ncbi:MAG: hypothetical protein IKC80_06290 [Kiritimatiellae bacterium]|nr:hypothetical protein [Kiritimatiellia bacterium]
MKAVKIAQVAAFSTLLACYGCGRLPEAEFDAGGVAYDFAAITESRFPIPKIGDKGNLVDAEEFFEDNWGKGREAKAKFITLPDNKGSRFRLSFKYKMRHTKGELGYAFVFYYNRDPKTGKLVERKDVKASYSYYDVWVLQNEWAQWNRFSREFTAPAGPDTVKIVLRLDGEGDLKFEDPGLVAVKGEPVSPVSFKMIPHGNFDGVYQVSEKQCGLMMYRWTDNLSEKINPKKCDFVFDFPGCVKFMGSTFADHKSVKREALPGGGERITFKASSNSFTPSRANPTLLVAAVGAVGSCGEGTLRVFKDGKQVSGDEKIRFEVVPQISSLRPKRYLNGVDIYQSEVMFGDAACDEAFAKFMGECGVGWVITGECSEKMISRWRENGVSLVTPTAKIANGYFMGDWQGRPKEDAFVGEKGKGATTWDGYMDRSSCPLAIIEERDYFVNHTVPKVLRPSLKGADGLWSNWEPFMFKGKGCNCARCEEEFKRYQAKTGGSRADFRSMLHGKMVRVIDKYVRKEISGKSVGFIPGVSWREMASSWREKNPSGESKPVDYAADFEWINPWGPYVYWDTRIPYIYQKRGPLAHFVMAKDIREQVDRDFPDPKRRPKLMSFPQGIQSSGYWAVQPQWLSMALDSFFFNRWESSVIYFFPEGYDARYWRAFADATTRAAKYEDFVSDGKRVDAKTLLFASEETYATPCRYVTTFVPRYRNVPLLQQASYEKDGTRIVAVFNFWERGEAFFTLKALSLPPGDYEIVDENGVLYPSSTWRRLWSAEELAQRGAFLYVGAARTRVFGIYPVGKAPARQKELSVGAIKSRFAERSGELWSAAKEDAAIEAANTVERTDKVGEL